MLPGIRQLSPSLKVDSTSWIVAGKQKTQQLDIIVETIEAWKSFFQGTSADGDTKIRTVQSQVLVEFDTLACWELGGSHMKVVALKSPGKVASCNHMACESTKRILVADHKGSGLVDESTFVPCIERIQREIPDGRLCLVVLDPSYLDRFCKLNTTRDNACMRDLWGNCQPTRLEHEKTQRTNP